MNPSGQSLHLQIDGTIEAVPSNRKDLEDGGVPGPKCHRLGECCPIPVSQCHVNGPGREREVRLCLPYDQSIFVGRFIASPSEKVSNLEPVEPVFLEFNLPENIRGSNIVRRSVVGVPIATDLERTCNVIELSNVDNFCCTILFDHRLNKNEGIGGIPHAFGGHLDPPGFAFLSDELIGVHIGGWKKCSADIAR